MKKAVVLLSGGLDSTTALALASVEYGRENVFALSFNYGQRHRVELVKAAKVAEIYAVRHIIQTIDLRSIGGSALTSDIPVPGNRELHEMVARIPVTYVPGRNTILLAFALSWAEVLEASVVVTGVNALDYSGYPDCRPEFIEAMNDVARLSSKQAVEGKPISIWAPLIDMTKKEIIQCGMGLKVEYGLTHSCYNPDSEGRACGICDSCILRRKGFEEAGVPDPTIYTPADGGFDYE